MIVWSFDMDAAPRDGRWIVILCERSTQHSEEPAPYVTTARWEEERHEVWVNETPDIRRREIRDRSHWDCYETPIAWAPMPDVRALLASPKEVVEAA